jgi:hypothetical protein
MSKSPDVSTVLLSALVSVMVATIVSLLVAFLVGGPIEVRKRKAVQRYEARSELVEVIRLTLNSVRVLLRSSSGWSNLNGKVTEFTDDFDEVVTRAEADYQRAIKHLASNDAQPEATTGDAFLRAGTYLGRIRHFRSQAIGKAEDALMAHGPAMREDLQDAERLLLAAQRCLQAGWIRSRWRRRALSRDVAIHQTRVDANEVPRTPLNYYYVALQLIAQPNWPD